MPSEKSRYLNRHRGPEAPIDFNVIHLEIDKMTQPDLSRMVYQATQYSTVLRRVVQLHAGFQKAAPDDIAGMKKAIDYALYLDDHVSYKHANSYCQLLDELQILIKRVADSGHVQVAIELLDHAFDQAECSSEWLQDGDYFEMSLDELRILKAHLLKKE